MLYRCLERSPHLLRTGEDSAFAGIATKRALVSVVVYPIAGALAFVAPVAALVAFVALPLFFIGTVFVSQPTSTTAQLRS